MKHLMRSVFFLFAVLVLAGTANARMEIKEDAFEFQQMRIVMFGENRGQLLVNECETCEDLVLEVDANTRFFKGETQLPLSEAIRYRGREGVAFMNRATGKVARIRIY